MSPIAARVGLGTLNLPGTVIEARALNVLAPRTIERGKPRRAPQDRTRREAPPARFHRRPEVQRPIELRRFVASVHLGRIGNRWQPSQAVLFARQDRDPESRQSSSWTEPRDGGGPDSPNMERTFIWQRQRQV